MRVVIQIGYRKALNRKREGQLIRAFVNDLELSWSDKTGKFLTSQLDAKKGLLWYLCQLDLQKEDVIRLEVSTSIAGSGKDEERTFQSLYYVDEEAPVREISLKGVGERGYPLIKGRILEIGSVSEKDKRVADIEEFLREDGF